MKETEVRQRLIDALEADLIGPFVPDSHPHGGEEVLPIAPSRWYLTGFLAPQAGRKPDADDQDSVDGGLAAGSDSQAEDAGSEEPEAIKIQNIKLVDPEGRPTKKNFARAAVYCDRTSCAYTEAKVPGLGLPVLFVDEQIYQEVPSFLVATVDKFAMMPWRGDAGMLFGRATHVDDQRAYGVMHEPPAESRPLPEGMLPPELAAPPMSRSPIRDSEQQLRINRTRATLSRV